MIDDGRSSADLSVDVGAGASLQCVARGNPQPTLRWVREDGREVIVGDGKAGQNTFIIR